MVSVQHSQVPASCRTTVTIPFEDHAELTRIAEAKRVSIGWVVRDAIRQYLDEEAPLLRTAQRDAEQ